MITANDLILRDFKQGDDSFSVIVEHEGHLYFLREVTQGEPGEDGLCEVTFDLAVAYETGDGLTPVEVTEAHGDIADQILVIFGKDGE